MNYSSRPILGAAALLLVACAVGVHGQQMSAAERASRERMAGDAAASEEREMTLELIERYHRSGEQREPRLALAQIREDFVRLQVVNNELAQAVAGGGRLDLKLVAKSASEIKKRAERIKENLALPEEDGGEKSPAVSTPADPEQLRTALSRLDGIILRFANELHAKGVRRFDAQASARLRLDLEAIIGLSGRVKKSSEKLGEAAH
jgi:predicted flap endonuclease-1-like 5' DNA nuclease